MRSASAWFGPPMAAAGVLLMMEGAATPVTGPLFMLGLGLIFLGILQFAYGSRGDR